MLFNTENKIKKMYQICLLDHYNEKYDNKNFFSVKKKFCPVRVNTQILHTINCNLLTKLIKLRSILHLSFDRCALGALLETMFDCQSLDSSCCIFACWLLIYLYIKNAMTLIKFLEMHKKVNIFWNWIAMENSRMKKITIQQMKIKKEYQLSLNTCFY